MIKYVFCDRCYYINWNRNISVRKCNCCLKIIEPTLKIENNFTISQNNLYKIKTDFSVQFKNPRSSGTLSISLTAVQTNALKAGRYVYDVEITKTSDAEVTRVVEGQIDVTPGVTRA